MKRTLILGALVASLAACEAAPEPPPPTDSSPQAGTQGPARGKPGERSSLAERVVEKNVVWPARSAIDTTTRSRFVAAEVEKVDASGVPVLAPSRGLAVTGRDDDDAAPFARAHVAARADWFTLSVSDSAFEAQKSAPRGPDGRGKGITVFVQGKRLAKRLPGVAPALGRDSLRGRPAWITQNEHVWVATWEENGVTYGVDLECGDVDDARCKDDAYLREVVESLAFVGGRGVAGGDL